MTNRADRGAAPVAALGSPPDSTVAAYQGEAGFGRPDPDRDPLDEGELGRLAKVLGCVIRPIWAQYWQTGTWCVLVFGRSNGFLIYFVIRGWARLIDGLAHGHI